MCSAKKNSNYLNVHGPYGLEIKIKEGAKLPRARQRMFTREEALEVKRQLEQQKNDGKIRESDSSASTLFMAKADGSKRLCMNMY
jgi:hypothetical protein